MPPPPSDPGPFLSLMGWLDDAGQIAPNLIRGRVGAAGRKTLDLLGDIPDAVLPYDLIPHTGDEDEYIRPSELVGLDPMQSPALAKITDMVGGAALNPLSYGARPIAAAGRLGRDVAAKGFQRLPDAVRRPIEQTATTTRRALNWLDVDPERDALMDQARAVGSRSTAIRQPEVERTLGHLDQTEREALGELMSRIKRKGTDRKEWSVLSSDEDVLGTLAPESRARVTQAKSDFQRLMGLMADDSNVGLAKDANYFPVQLRGKYFEDTETPDFLRDDTAMPSPLKGRVLETPEQRLDFLRNNEADMEFDALKVASHRAAQQARAQEKAFVGAKLLPEKRADFEAKLAAASTPEEASLIRDQLAKVQGDFKLTNNEHRSAVRQMISEIGAKDSDTGYKLANFFNGVEGRKGALSLLALGNKYFKSAATFGILMPRMSFNVGNRFSNVWQQASAGDDRLRRAGKSLVTSPRDLFASIDDGIMKLTGKGRWAKDELTDMLDVVDQAAKNARGDMKAFDAFIDANGGPHKAILKEALEDGVLNGFVNTEQLINQMAATPWRKQFQNIMDWPAAIAKGVEQRIRLGTYADIRKSGADRAIARQTTKDTALDYDVPGVANRTFRDIVPFGAFLSQNVKQQAKFLADKPFVAAAAAPLFTSDDGTPKYPWMENQMALPTGLDEEGNPQFLTSFRMPIEGLASIPGGSGTDWYRDVVGNLQPLLKSGIAYMADKDPFTGREYGTYDKIMGTEAGELGRAFNVIKGTGLVQPLTTPLDQIANWTDERKSAKEKAIQGLTGLRFTSVDPLVAERQRLEDYLGSNPDVSQYKGYFRRDGDAEDPGLSALLKQLAESKKRLAEKRKASEAVL